MKKKGCYLKKFFQLLVRPRACFKIEFAWKIGENTSLRIFIEILHLRRTVDDKKD